MQQDRYSMQAARSRSNSHVEQDATAQQIRLQQARANLELGKTRAGQNTCVELTQGTVRQPASWSAAGPVPPVRTPYAPLGSLLGPALSVDSCCICPSTVRLRLSTVSVSGQMAAPGVL